MWSSVQHQEYTEALSGGVTHHGKFEQNNNHKKKKNPDTHLRYTSEAVDLKSV